MHILIVEDERPIARYLKDLTIEILGEAVSKISLVHHLAAAEIVIDSKKIDLLLLDLNLNGLDGYKLLSTVVAESFHTIIVSANQDKAIRAFEYGVLDFVRKPFTKDRLKKAYDRYTTLLSQNTHLKFLLFKTKGKVVPMEISEVKFIKGSRNYSKVTFKDSTSMIHDKSLDTLMGILPTNFHRIHKSYITDLRLVNKIVISKGSIYHVQLKDGTELPIGRTRYKDLKERFSS